MLLQHFLTTAAGIVATASMYIVGDGGMQLSLNLKLL